LPWHPTFYKTSRQTQNRWRLVVLHPRCRSMVDAHQRSSSVELLRRWTFILWERRLILYPAVPVRWPGAPADAVQTHPSNSIKSWHGSPSKKPLRFMPPAESVRIDSARGFFATPIVGAKNGRRSSDAKSVAARVPALGGGGLGAPHCGGDLICCSNPHSLPSNTWAGYLEGAG
jgi:hypothetical protein